MIHGVQFGTSMISWILMKSQEGKLIGLTYVLTLLALQKLVVYLIWVFVRPNIHGAIIDYLVKEFGKGLIELLLMINGLKVIISIPSSIQMDGLQSQVSSHANPFQSKRLHQILQILKLMDSTIRFLEIVQNSWNMNWQAI